MPRNARFVDFIEGHAPATPVLPLVHTTNVVAFDQIMKSDEISLSFCKYYRKDLSYFFYAKPTYKLRRGESLATRLLGDAAICFVLDAHTMPEPLRTFALDTGASFGGRYDDLLPNGVGIEDFELPPTVRACAQLVTAFYGDNRSYYDGIMKSALPTSALDRVSEVISSIGKSVASQAFDERACSCEIQFDVAISLKTCKIETIVMPAVLYSEPEVSEIVSNKWKTKPVVYRFKRSTPEERTEVIFENLGRYYEHEKLI